MKVLLKGETAFTDGFLITPEELKIFKIGKQCINEYISQMEKEQEQCCS